MLINLINKISKIYTYFVGKGFYEFGTGIIIKPILNTTNREFISIGKNVNIGSFSWIAVSTEFAGTPCTSNNRVRLIIGDNTSIGNNAFIIANNYLKIGSNVIISNYVYISDHHHGFNDIHNPITQQSLTNGDSVVIGDNVFVGTKACILPNVRIGERSIIGAASVVTKDVPPYHIVAGNPAKKIKKYDFSIGRWVKC